VLSELLFILSNTPSSAFGTFSPRKKPLGEKALEAKGRRVLKKSLRNACYVRIAR
jgi:hypothetical protein